jgi:putative IMPACT (imprinted ancient) family translation regulator
VPGLINAYKSVTAMALQLTPVLQKSVLKYYKLHFDYTRMNDVMMIIKQYGCEIHQQQTQLFCEMIVGVPKARLTEVLHKFNDLQSIEISEVL